MQLKKTVTGVSLALGSMAIIPGMALAVPVSMDCAQGAYETPGTITCTVPDGVKKMTGKVWGGGGAGGGVVPEAAVGRGGAGGGGGGYSYGDFYVTPGDTLTIIVGAGGTGASGAAGGPGGKSDIDFGGGPVLSAGGGAGGAANTAGGAPVGGTGGLGSTENGQTGGNGSTGGETQGTSGAGGDAGGLYYGGGTGGTGVGGTGVNANGNDGNPYGGGGSGSRSNSSNNSGTITTGGNGADGAVLLKWADPAKPDAYKSEVSAYPYSGIFANGVSYSTLTVKVNNAYGDGIPGLAYDIDCTAEAPSYDYKYYSDDLPEIGYFKEAYGYPGVYEAKVTSMFDGKFKFTCSVDYDGKNGMPLLIEGPGPASFGAVTNDTSGDGYNGYGYSIELGKTYITFVAPTFDEGNSEIRANGSLIGATVPLNDIVNVTVLVVDDDGVPIVGKEVTLSVDSASSDINQVEIIDPPGNVVTTDENGVANFVVYSGVAQTVTFEAEWNPTLDIDVTWQPRAIPTLGPLGLLALSGLIGLFGWFGAARRRRLG